MNLIALELLNPV